MPDMVDPSVPLADFQEAVKQGSIVPRPCVVDPTLWFHYDEPMPGSHRMTYVRLEKKVVTAFVMIAPAESYQGLHCFGVGVATPEPYRRQGNAQKIVRAAIAEFTHMSREAGVMAFFLDACVSIDNVASQRVAERVFGTAGQPVTDSLSGKPSLQYFLKVTAD